MITCYYSQDGQVLACALSQGDDIPESTLWIDMLNATPDEEAYVKMCLGIAIPSHDEVWKNEILNRLYRENGIAYMIAAIITKLQSPHPEISPITFILTKTCLVTVRDIEPTSFKHFSQRMLQNTEHFASADAVLEGLLEEVLTRVAHNAELLIRTLDALSHKIFGAESIDGKISGHNEVMKNVLLELGSASDLNSKINESLHSISRMLLFYYELEGHDEDVRSAIHMLKTDTKVLMQQSSFTADKITFQLDATLGMINVEQNMIIKMFSVVAVFFLPPTMVSSIYGMNFQHMPELSWLAGYPMALGIMVMFAVIPYVYFKKKGWL